VPEPAVTAPQWRGIDELAELVGGYCWVEHRIFEITGAWATGPGDGLASAVRVWCAGVSRLHGLLAGRWAERLPVRAGVERGTLVVAPAGPLAGAFDALAATPAAVTGVAAVVQTVFPRLHAVYLQHARTGSPVSEGPVLQVLAAARLELAAQSAGGGDLLKEAGDGLTRDAVLEAGLERAFAETGVFPAVPPS
jgi:hypothetical protein